jgi:hypothetical protein
MAKKKGQTIKWPKKRTQYNGQNKKGQTIQWPRKRTDNTMVKIKKDRQYNGPNKGQTIQWSK